MHSFVSLRELNSLIAASPQASSTLIFCVLCGSLGVLSLYSRQDLYFVSWYHYDLTSNRNTLISNGA